MLITLYLIFLGLLLLAFAFDKHFKQISNKTPSKTFKIIANTYGVILLIIPLFKLINTFGLSLGICYYLGLVGIIIMFIALILAYKPKILLVLSILFPLIILFL